MGDIKKIGSGLMIAGFLFTLVSCATFQEDIAFMWERIQRHHKCMNVMQPTVKLAPSLHTLGVYSPLSNTIYVRNEFMYDVLEEELVKACLYQSGQPVYEELTNQYTGEKYWILR